MAELNIVEKVIALEGVELFERLPPSQLSRVAAIASEAHYPPGRVIFRPGDALDVLYVILDGTVELARNGEVLHVAGRGEALGVWSLFDDTPLPLSATARDDVALLCIARDDFQDLLADNVEVMAAIFSTIVKRFRKLVEQT